MKTKNTEIRFRWNCGTLLLWLFAGSLLCASGATPYDVRVYTNIADMVDNADPTVPDPVRVLGYHVEADGGGGMFVPVNTVSNPDLGTRFLSDVNAAWSFDRITEGEWNLRWFGAKGDGVNDHASVAAAVEVAGAAGKSLYVPPGDYALTNAISLPDNFVLHGSGVKSKIMLQTGLTVNTLGVVHVDGKTNVTIRNLHIAQNGYHTTTNATTGNFTGIYLRNADHCTVRDCIITGYAGQGLIIQTSDHARVLRNKFPDPGHVDSVEKQAQVQDIRLFDSSYCLIEGNECFSLGEHPGESGISLYGGWTEHAGGLGGGTAISSEYNVVQGNVVKRKTQCRTEC